MTTPIPQSNRSIESPTNADMDRRTSSILSTSRAAAFFVNDKPVKIREERPTVRAICEAAGYKASGYRVFRLSQQDDPSGREIKNLDERLSATLEKPMYLRCEKKDERAPIAGVAPGTVGGEVGDINRPLNIDDLHTSPSRPRDYARDVGRDAPGGPPRPE